METHIYNLQIRVLIFREDAEFVAKALEMDLTGYGKTEVEAVEDLKKTVEAQISFASQMNDSSLLEFPAEKEFFYRWEDFQRKALQSQILGDKCVKLKAKAVFIQFSQEEIKALRTRTFKPVAGLVCA